MGKAKDFEACRCKYPHWRYDNCSPHIHPSGINIVVNDKTNFDPE